MATARELRQNVIRASQFQRRQEAKAKELSQQIQTPISPELTKSQSQLDAEKKSQALYLATKMALTSKGEEGGKDPQVQRYYQALLWGDFGGFSKQERDYLEKVRQDVTRDPATKEKKLQSISQSEILKGLYGIQQGYIIPKTPIAETTKIEKEKEIPKTTTQKYLYDRPAGPSLPIGRTTTGEYVFPETITKKGDVYYTEPVWSEKTKPIKVAGYIGDYTKTSIPNIVKNVVGYDTRGQEVYNYYTADNTGRLVKIPDKKAKEMGLRVVEITPFTMLTKSPAFKETKEATKKFLSFYTDIPQNIPKYLKKFSETEKGIREKITDTKLWQEFNPLRDYGGNLFLNPIVKTGIEIVEGKSFNPLIQDIEGSIFFKASEKFGEEKVIPKAKDAIGFVGDITTSILSSPLYIGSEKFGEEKFKPAIKKGTTEIGEAIAGGIKKMRESNLYISSKRFGEEKIIPAVKKGSIVFAGAVGKGIGKGIETGKKSPLYVGAEKFGEEKVIPKITGKPYVKYDLVTGEATLEYSPPIITKATEITGQFLERGVGEQQLSLFADYPQYAVRGTQFMQPTQTLTNVRISPTGEVSYGKVLGEQPFFTTTPSYISDISEEDLIKTKTEITKGAGYSVGSMLPYFAPYGIGEVLMIGQAVETYAFPYGREKIKKGEISPIQPVLQVGLGAFGLRTRFVKGGNIFGYKRTPVTKTEIDVIKPAKIKKTPLSYTYPEEVEFEPFAPSPEQRISAWKFGEEVKPEPLIFDMKLSSDAEWAIAQQKARLKSGADILYYRKQGWEIRPKIDLKKAPVVYDIFAEPKTKVNIPKPKRIRTIQDFIKPVEEEAGQIVKSKTGQEQIQLLKPVEEVVQKEKVYQIVEQAEKKEVADISKGSPLLQQLGFLEKQKQSPFQLISLSDEQIQKLNQQQIQQEKQTPKQKYGGGQILTLGLLPKQRFQFGLGLLQPQAFGQAQPELQFFAQPQPQALVQRQGYTQAQPQQPLFRDKTKQIPKQKLIPKFIPASIPEEKIAKKKTVEEWFEVFGKRFGRDIELFKAKTKEEAKQKLKGFLKGTLGRSGFITKGGKKLSFAELGFKSQEFRPAKKDVTRIVQKAKFSLGTPSEVSEIQFFKRQKGSKKKKKGWFS